MGIEGKLLVSRKNIVVNKESIGIDNDLTKDRNMNTFKTYCKRRKSSARFPDRKANNRLCACHCIAGNDVDGWIKEYPRNWSPMEALSSPLVTSPTSARVGK